MKYPGAELDSFDKATIWRKYIYSKVKKFIKGDVLEVGAGIGSFTKNYEKLIRKLTLSEIDPDNLTIIKKKFSNPKFSFTNKFTKDLEENFDTIMYLNVLDLYIEYLFISCSTYYILYLILCILDIIFYILLSRD